MDTVEELGLHDRDKALEFVHDYAKKPDLQERLDEFLDGNMWVGSIQDVPQDIIKALLSNLEIQAILAGTEMSEIVLERFWVNSPRFEKIMGWVPDINDECVRLNRLQSHSKSMQAKINGILRKQFWDKALTKYGIHRNFI